MLAFSPTDDPLFDQSEEEEEPGPAGEVDAGRAKRKMKSYKASEDWVNKCDDGVISDALKTPCACIEPKKHFGGGRCIGKTTMNGARALRKKENLIRAIGGCRCRFRLAD